jgi:hypothetical protein
MKLDFVNSVSKAIVCVKYWRISIGELTQPKGFSSPHERAEGFDSLLTPRPAFTSQSFLQLRIVLEQVVIL